MYYPIIFETKLDARSIYNLIVSKQSHFLNDYSKQLHDNLADSINNEIKQIQKNDNSKKSLIARIKREIMRKKLWRASKAHSNDAGDIKIQISPREKGIIIELINKGQEELNSRIEVLSEEQRKCEEIYGEKFVSLQRRLVLLPVKAQLVNGEQVWLNAVLYIFADKAGILKLELPLHNVNTFPLKCNEIDKYVSKFYSAWNISNFREDFNLSNIHKFYLSFLLFRKKLSITSSKGPFKNIILSDFEGMPENIQRISDSMQDELFRIICAPVYNTECNSYKSVIKKYLQEHSWGYHGIRYFLSTTGRCLSIVDKDCVNSVIAKYKEYNDVKEISDKDRAKIQDIIVQSACINTELALIILLLKKINLDSTYFKKVYNKETLHRVQFQFNKGIMFICELQEECFGTVSEQIEMYEAMMPFYLKTKIVQDKISAVDQILQDAKIKRDKELQNIISFLGLTLTTAFGLPVIIETMSILRNLCSFISYDIPVVTTEGVSVAIWLFFIGIIIGNMVKSRLKSKLRFNS